MGGIIDKITEFIKELLQGWVLTNFETMFTDVNDKVGTIAGEVSKTPSTWNSGIFDMIKTLSDNVMIPIAGMIISFVLVYELISMVIDKNNLHDFNCGLKAYKNIVIKNIEVYNDMHRYIPYLAKIAGFHKIGEKVVQHQARKYGTTKFGLNRFVNGYLDLITLWFTSKFGKKPMHFFGLWGSVMFFIGFIALVIVLSMKLVSMFSGDLRPLVTNSPFFYISLTAMILGTQMFLAGFIGELISRNAPNRNNYKIETEI